MRSASLHLLRALVAALAVGAMVVAGHTASALGSVGARQQGSSNFVYFSTPGRLTHCVYYGHLAKAGYAPYLICGRLPTWLRPSVRPAKVTLMAAGRPQLESPSISRGLSQPRLVGVLRFGESWWGNQRGEWGKGRSRGRVLFRCASRESGLTCRSRSGHGFWLGRTRGYRVF